MNALRLVPFAIGEQHACHVQAPTMNAVAMWMAVLASCLAIATSRDVHGPRSAEEGAVLQMCVFFSRETALQVAALEPNGTLTHIAAAVLSPTPSMAMTRECLTVKLPVRTSVDELHVAREYEIKVRVADAAVVTQLLGRLHLARTGGRMRANVRALARDWSATRPTVSGSGSSVIVRFDVVHDALAGELNAASWMERTCSCCNATATWTGGCSRAAEMGSMSNASTHLGSLSLAEAVLPGTHDSGTFNLTRNSIIPPSSFVAIVEDACAILHEHGLSINCSDPLELAEVLTIPWAVTQPTNWTGQLLAGCRSFDYRGYYLEEQDVWVAEHSVHGNEWTSAVSLAREVSAFLSAHPGEIVIIEYGSWGAGDINDLQQRLVREIGQYAYVWDEGTTIPGNPSIAEMVAANQRAVLVQQNGGQRDPVSVGIQNDYPNSCNANYIESYDATAIELFANETSDAMRKIGWQVTADAECIAAGIIGSVLGAPRACDPLFHFDCALTLMGYISQINDRFSLQYVLDAYTSVTPLPSALYFGNLWNFDAPSWSFTSIAPVLNAILLANRQ